MSFDNFNPRHFATTYHLPSWQGGDIERPICRTGRQGWLRHALTSDPEAVQCPQCRAILAAKKAAPKPVVPVFHGEPVTPTQIIAYVAAKHGLTVDDLKGPSQLHRIAHVRQEAMWELRQRTKLSLIQIARRVGRTDHATAHHGILAHEARMAEAHEVAA